MSLQTSHISRRRRASQSPNWVRRAGVAGGVIGTLALTGMSAPANAEPSAADPATTGSIPVIPALSTTATAAEAADAIDETVVEQQLDAARAQARTEAMKAAQKKKAAADARSRAEAKAAKARETATASRSAGRTALAASSSTSATGSVASVIGFLKAQVGKPYVYGATGPSAYDCSGLTQAAFRTIGVELPRTSQAQSTFGTPVSVSAVQPGDLVFWGGVGSAYHVAVYIGGGQYLDAANPSKGVVIQQMSNYMPTSAVRVL
ncbi:C40 family peptidase [Streptomyces sp. NPDC058864]